jgi:hypothetical protein
MLAIAGSQIIEITNKLQQYKKAKINLKKVFNAEIGMVKRTIPRITTTAKKYIRIGPSDDSGVVCITSPDGLVVVPGQKVTDSAG